MQSDYDIFIRVLGVPYSEHCHLLFDDFTAKYKQELEDFYTFSKSFRSHNSIVTSTNTPFVDRLARYYGLGKAIRENHVEYYRGTPNTIK